MAESEKSTTEEVVACEICLREVPTSEAKSVEAADYFLYFCGAECYAKWAEQAEKEEAQLHSV